MINIYYISEKPIQNNHAGNKARVDIDDILEKKNLIKYETFNQILVSSKIIKLFKICSIKYLTKLIKLLRLKDKVLIMQYPFCFDRITNFLFKLVLRKNNTILFIHDVDSLRSLDTEKIKKDISVINKAQFVIVHNQKMKKILEKHGLRCKVIILELFDYLLINDKPTNNYRYGKEIVFAGNLEKSEFLKTSALSDLNLQFNLYGPNYNKNDFNSKNIDYKGSYTPDEIPYKLEGSFGLIWDGNSTETCSGRYGTYLKYNNPHKLSLYIAAGLPVITWNEAAIADFIEKHKIGFTVNGLYEISEAIDKLSLEEYEEYKNNLKELQRKVSKGFYTKTALDEVIEKINQDEQTL